ncbi:hypothetical protein DMNBHIDG_00034 [Candidatus Methanoperedenaceae archaeon GB37]|nr:hypothetical protein DMNBHIDG_00034 [Candidatus Methanoperedenaceae archaeon GB37]
MAGKCLILPELSISSYGKVKSVILFSRIPITALDGQPGHAYTSFCYLYFAVKVDFF